MIAVAWSQIHDSALPIQEGPITGIGIDWSDCTLAHDATCGRAVLLAAVWRPYICDTIVRMWWYCRELDRSIIPPTEGPAENVAYQIDVCEVRVVLNPHTDTLEFVAHVGLSATLQVIDNYNDVLHAEAVVRQRTIAIIPNRFLHPPTRMRP